MGRAYVTDLIGEEYKKWEPGDWVLLSYPTGMGKTYFILHTLLHHAASLGCHLVYYCNRKFLSLQFDAIVKQQLLEDLGEKGKALAHYLHVRTYQNAELTGSYPNVYNTAEARDYRGNFEVLETQVMYYVFDEAQYAISDSPVNPGTAFWLGKKAALEGNRGIRIFLTATPEPFLLFRECLQNGEPTAQMMTFLARYYVKRSASHGKVSDHWVKYLSRHFIELLERQNHADFKHMKTRVNPSLHFTYSYSKLADREYWKKEAAKERDRVIEECQEPFRELYGLVEDAYGREPEHHYRLDTSPSDYYSYVEERYFDEWAELADCIADSAGRGERWLIFVRRKDDGEMLQAILQSRRCSSVAVNANNTKSYDGRQVPRRSPRNRALDALVWKQELGCNVLISTSVLDNGVSLHADAVDHLVLCQPGKTSFLQMLGRVRVREGQKLKVYIQRQTPKRVKGYIDQCKKDILFFVRWQLNGLRIPRKRFHLDIRDTVYIPFIDETESLTRERLENEHRPRYLVKQKDGTEEANLLVFYHLLGTLYDMDIRAKVQGDDDPNYYLRHQLSWLGKEYDPTRWVNFQQTEDELIQYLERLAESGLGLGKEAQVSFRRDCLRMLTELRRPKPYFDNVKARFNLEREDYPGMKVLNTAFEDAQIPYVIKNKQEGKSRGTNWYIEKIPSAKESEHPLQDAPTLTDSQDTSDGSYLPSSDIPAG